MTQAQDKMLSWFIFRALPMGNPVRKALIDRFKDPDAIFNAPAHELKKTQGLSPRALCAILSHDELTSKAIRELESVSARRLSVLVYTDPVYPALLREIPDPPMVLFYDGRLNSEQPCFSIVGSRKATSYGKNIARHLAKALACRGFCLVSGMASGIDTEAHKGALDAGGTTLAVMGAGLNHVYPSQNKGLYRKIAASGAALSEFSLDDPPRAGHFPVRNRIIAGISCGTLVVEAARKSGALITARLAGEYNREVFAVPGSILSSQSRGTHRLLRDGARLVENEADIIEELGQFVSARGPENGVWNKKKPGQTQGIKKSAQVMDKAKSLVYNHLDPYPRHIDEIINAAGIESSRVLVILTELELSGVIRRHPGNLFSLSKE